MKNNISIKGQTIKLRLVTLKDSKFILKLRTDEELNRFIHKGSINLESQTDWIRKYLEKENDYYFVIETILDKKPVGVISIYDIKDNHAEWGRWILLKGNNFAIESVYLIYKIAFEIMKLEYIFCRTVEDNKSVVSFHNSCGLKLKKVLKNHFFLNENHYNAVEHVLNCHEWKGVNEKLEKLTFLISKKL